MKDFITKVQSNIKTVFIAVLLIVIGLMAIQSYLRSVSAKKLQNNLIKELYQADSTKEVLNGTYQKTVELFETERTLVKKLKSENRELHNLIKDRDERILGQTEVILSFESKVDVLELSLSGKKDIIDGLKAGQTISFSSHYPDSANWFAKTLTSIKLPNATVEWTIKDIPINITLTETKAGTWKQYVEAPDWLKINSIKSISLPPEKIVKKQPVFRYHAGAGINFSLLSSDFPVVVSGGVSVKDNFMVTGSIGSKAAIVTINKIFSLK